MKVIDQRDKVSMVTFGELKDQDVFELVDMEGIFMKICIPDHLSSYTHVAVRLSNCEAKSGDKMNHMQVVCIMYSAQVLPLEVELNIVKYK